MNTKTIEEQLEEIDVIEVCNCCGEKFRLNNTTNEGIVNQGKIVSQKIYWGYGSQYDGEEWQYCVCESCVSKFTNSFKIPVEKTDPLGYSDENLAAMQEAYGEVGFKVE